MVPDTMRIGIKGISESEKDPNFLGLFHLAIGAYSYFS
jgi:hypothetical protein